MIEIVSELTQLPLKVSNKALAADGRDDKEEAQTMATGAVVPNALAEVNEDTAMVATEPSSTDDATVIACTRSAGGDALETSEVHLSESVELAMHVCLSSATPLPVTRSQSAEREQS